MKKRDLIIIMKKRDLIIILMVIVFAVAVLWVGFYNKNLLLSTQNPPSGIPTCDSVSNPTEKSCGEAYCETSRKCEFVKGGIFSSDKCKCGDNCDDRRLPRSKKCGKICCKEEQTCCHVDGKEGQACCDKEDSPAGSKNLCSSGSILGG